MEKVADDLGEHSLLAEKALLQIADLLELVIWRVERRKLVEQHREDFT